MSSETLVPITAILRPAADCASAVSACNWTSYHTFNVMVLKCMRYITCVTLNVSRTGCTVVSQLEFELGSLVVSRLLSNFFLKLHGTLKK